MSKSKPQIHCSFCGKSVAQVQKLIRSDLGSAICNECIQLCVDMCWEDGLAIIVSPAAAMARAKGAKP